MKKILALAGMELFFSVRRISFGIYYGVLFFLTSLFVHILGGAFSSFMVVSDTTIINGPQYTDSVISGITLITTFIVASFSSGTALRDYRYGSHEITFTLPVSRYQYVLGKFGGAYLTNLLLFTAPLLSYALIYPYLILPWLNRDLFASFEIMTYLNIFFQKILINIFFLSAAFFMLGLLLRNVVVNWVAIIILYVLFYMGQRYYGETNTRTLGALLDPYGIISTRSITVGRSSDQRASQGLVLTGLYLWNRVLWAGIGLALLSFTLWRFRFSYEAALFSIKKWTYAPLKNLSPAPLSTPSPLATKSFGAKFTQSSFISQLKLECRQIFRNVYFWLISIIGVCFLVASSFTIGKLLETPGYPTTIRVVEVYTGVMHIFLLLLLMVFSGEVVWRDKQNRLDGITGSTPARQSVRLAAKTLAIYIPVLIMLGIVFVAGPLLQISKDFYVFNIPLYCKYIFGYSAIIYLFYALLAIGLQALSNGKYQGYFLFATVYTFFNFFGDNLIQQGFLIPGHFPDVDYSDISGFQGAFYPFYIFAAYWLLFAIIIWRAGVKIWAKSADESWKSRWSNLLQGGLRRHRATSYVLIGCFLGLGLFIFYNTNILNEHHTSEYYYRQKAAYEKQYIKYRTEPQLSLSSVKGNLDIFPASRSMKAKMILILLNKTSLPVNRIYLNYPKHEYFKNEQVNIGWKLILNDKDKEFYGYELSKVVLPGDSIIYSYDFDYRTKGFTDEGIASMINENGTFINNTTFLPVIGYDASNELDGNKLRKKYGLGIKPYALAQTDPIGLQQNMLGQGADRIRLALTVSTVSDQTAIAPGYLIKEWTNSDRKYYSYEMDMPAVNYYSIQSGRYDVSTEVFKIPTDSAGRNVQLAVYYHPAHKYNIAVMMQGMKDALAYYTANFGPYQYRQLRIIEFPGSSFAQSFANTIPFSESIGFLADLRDTATSSLSNKPADYVYYVTAHETAHQWWAHQILPANTEGANFLCEALAQYSALMLMKHKYGEDRTRKFLEMESFNYLGSRGSESKEERPLANVLMEQQYIFYQKGGCMWYALQHYLGEDRINQVLKSFVHDFAFRERPYVTSNELISRLKAATPDSLKYLVDDCLNKIVLYDNKIENAVYSMNNSTLEYTVEANIAGKKLSYTNRGKESEVPMNDWQTIGIYSNEGKLVATQKVKIQSGVHKIVFNTLSRPAKIMMNPDYDLQEKQYLRSNAKTEVKQKK